MKTRLKISAVLVVTLVSLYGIQFSEHGSSLSDLNYANIEALAQNEGSTGCKWAKRTLSDGSEEQVCMANGSGYDCVCGDIKQL